MRPGLRIRLMTAQDLDAVMALAATLDYAPHWPRSGYEAALQPGLWPERIAFIAETAASRIAGFLVAVLIPPEAELESIAVAAEFQRRGVARGLFAELNHQLAARNCSEVLLEVRVSNQAGRAFYQAIGFVEIGLRSGYYADPIEDAILMRLEIPPQTSSKSLSW